MRIRLQLAVVVAVALLVAATIVYVRNRGGHSDVVRLPAATASTGGPASHVSFLERLIPPSQEQVAGPAAPRSLADLARRLPLDRAVAQLFLFGFDGKDTSAPIFSQLERLDLGGLVLDGRNYDSAQQLAGLTGQLVAKARATRHIPPWIAAEQDGGDYSAFGDLPPTHPPADYHSAADAAAALADAAGTVRALGVNALLEPDLDVAARDGVLGAQAFSDDPRAVAEYAKRVVDACRRRHVFCAAKHFPGLGAANTPTDQGPAEVGLSIPQLMARDLVPFQAAIKAGMPGVVVGEGLYAPDDFVTPAALSSNVIGRLLRKRLAFGGLAITDDLADPGVSTFAQVPDAAVDALKAGADMIYISGDAGDQEAAYTAVLGAVRAGQIPQARVRASLLRILLAKRAYGLLVTRAAPPSP